MTNNIQAFADAIIKSEELQRRRKEHQERLGEPLIFIAFEDTPGHGQGWFKIDDNFYRYYKYSYGYDLYPNHVIPVEMIKDLSKFI